MDFLLLVIACSPCFYTYSSGTSGGIRILQQALTGIDGTSCNPNMFHNLTKVVLCHRCNTFASFSEDDLRF